jgi:hypothetical protein
MKIKLYYVVRGYKSGVYSVAKDSDAVLISGPYSSQDGAQSVVNSMENPYDYSVVVSDLQVKIA